MVLFFLCLLHEAVIIVYSSKVYCSNGAVAESQLGSLCSLWCLRSSAAVQQCSGPSSVTAVRRVS